VAFELQNRGFLDSTPCRLPCWEGLLPGHSTEAEVRERLDSPGFISTTTVSETPYDFRAPSGEILDGTMLTAMCLSPSDEVCVELSLAGETLYAIRIYPNFALVLGDLVDALGDPVSIAAMPSGVEHPDCLIEFAWEREQLLATHFEPYSREWPEVCQAVRRGEGVSSGLRIDWVSIESDDWFAAMYPREVDLQWPGYTE
jgi:hypothetical protein